MPSEDTILEKISEYGKKLSHYVKKALAIYERTGTYLWQGAVEKEMISVMPAFEFKDDNRIPVGHSTLTAIQYLVSRLT